MAITNSTFVRQLYQTVLARDPDAAGSSFWTGQLDSGFFTRGQVAFNFLGGGEYEQGAEVLARLFYAAFKRIPDMPGLQFWMSVARQGAGLDQIATQFVKSSEFSAVNGQVLNNGTFVDILYSNVLGRAADAGGRANWVSLLDSGTSFGSILSEFARSNEFQTKANPVVTNAMAYYAIVGRAPTTDELANQPKDLSGIVLGALGKVTSDSVPTVTGLSYSAKTMTESSSNDGSIGTVLTITLSGDTFKGNIGATLGKFTGVPTGLTGSLTKTTDTTATLMLTGAATSHGSTNSSSLTTATFSAADFVSGVASGKAGLVQGLTVSFIEFPATESSGDLTLSGSTSVLVKVDLANDKLYFGTSLGTLASGTMANAKNVDASNLTSSKVTVNIIGDDVDNKLLASPAGGSLTGGKGADTLTGNSGIDRFVFSATAADNGVDTITGFTLGSGGDVLDFSAFLNKTGTTHITPGKAGVAGTAVWANGDVLVATGYSLDTAAEIAALFNPATGPFAAPTAASKTVVITADIVGDASVWYVVNQTAATAIDSSEVTLVGTLKSVNNLDLTGYGFVTTNFG